MCDQPKSNIPEWIQAIAVCIAIASATWEFVLQDRAESNAKKEYVRQLILAGQSESITNSAQEMTRKIRRWMDHDVGEMELVEVSAAFLPYEAYFNAWGFCVKNDLCNKELALGYICRDAKQFNSIGEAIRRHLGGKGTWQDENYKYLLEACESV